MYKRATGTCNVPNDQDSPMPDSTWSPVDVMDECSQLSLTGKRKIASAAINESDNDTLPFTVVHKKQCRIDDAAAVETFLRQCLKDLQQLVVKAIAKAWIKGICPKKQAKFPYRSNRKSDTTPGPTEVPLWWPPIETCPFVEPDHIDRHGT